MNIPGPRLRELNEALLDAFDPPGLERMLRFRLNLVLNRYSTAGDATALVFALTTAIQKEGRLPFLRFVDAARREKPDNERLAAVAQALGVATADGGLERKVRVDLPFVNIARWRTRLTELENQVCRVEVAGPGGTGYGTAFLVAPDVVMTNYHVVDRVIEGKVAPGSVGILFDFKLLADGVTLSPAKAVALAKEWHVASSPPVAGAAADPAGKAFAGTGLDFALLRLAESAGDERGYVRVGAGAPGLEVDAPLFIVQHPEAKPLKLAFDTKSILSVAETRVRYRTNTEPGSSGSPCFDVDWNLIALHHSGDPAYANPAWNEGIPIGAIVDCLSEHGMGDVLAKGR